jgi:hypothetical protein
VNAPILFSKLIVVLFTRHPTKRQRFGNTIFCRYMLWSTLLHANRILDDGVSRASDSRMRPLLKIT